MVGNVSGRTLCCVFSQRLCNRVLAIVPERLDLDICTDCLENTRWQNGHSREVSALMDVNMTSMTMQ